MKAILILLLALGVANITTSEGARAKEQGAAVANKQKAGGLELSLVARKRRYKRTDQIKLDVLLTNTGKEPVYIFGTLDWGYRASLNIHILDASGREVQPFFEDLVFPSPNDKSAFVKLLQHHFLGTNFFTPADVLNMNRPGRYAIYVEYQSPFSANDVELTPFWGKENGRIRSNVVSVEIVR